MKHGKKAALLAVAISVALAGCASGEPTSSGPVELDFLSLAWQPGAVEANKVIVDQWNADNPDIQVNLVQGDWDSVDDLLTTSFEGGTEPDLFHNEDTALRTYAERGNVLDLGQYVSDDFRASIPEAAWESVQFDGIDGVWGVPFLHESTVVFANKDALDAAGIELPTVDDPWAWDEFAAVAQELSSEGVYGAAFGLKGASGVTRIANVGYSTGAEFFVQDGENWTTQFGEGEKVLPELLRSMIDSGSMSVDVTGLGSSDLTANFLQGRFVTFFGGDYIRSQIIDGAPSFEWVTLPAPTGVNSNQSNFAQTISISSGTENPEAAVAFLEYFTNAENQVKLALGDWELPTATDALADPAFADSSVGWDVVVGTAANLKRLPYQQIPNFAEWTDAVAPAFLEYFTGAGDIDRLASEVKEAGDAVLSRAN